MKTLCIVFAAVSGRECYNCKGALRSICATNITEGMKTECSNDQKCGLVLEEYTNGVGTILR